MEVELASWHEGKVSEIAEGFEVLKGLIDIIGVKIGTVVYILNEIQMLMVVMCGLLLMSLAKQLSPANEAEFRFRVVRLVMLGKSRCLR